MTDLFRSCLFLGSWIFIQTHLDFYRVVTQCHNYRNSYTFNPFFGLSLFILFILYCACGFQRIWVTWRYSHGV